MASLLTPTRRAALLTLGAGLAAPALVRAQGFRTDPFSLGVASGDPAPDGFVLWTRLAPEPLEPHGGMTLRPVTVSWEIGSDETLRTVVQKGDAIARPELGHAVHVEVAGLQPDRPYWYRFNVGPERSQIGRARTTPAVGAPARQLRFAVAGCQAYTDGLFTAYGHLAQEPELAFVYHYGDYIYEGRDNPTRWDWSRRRTQPVVRRHMGQECYTLEDYRRRYALYKTDVDLRNAHAAAPFIASWDDHEIDNNWASALDQDGTPPEVFAFRKAAAMQAWYEHMPVRAAQRPRGDSLQLHRRLAWGDLLSAHLLDTRQYRTNQPCGDGVKTGCPGQDDPAATLTGAAQERWLFDGLSSSRARWNLLAQQVMVMPLDRRTEPEATEPVWNLDSWSGYRASRKRLVDHITGRKLRNVVIATGDEHQHYAGEVRTRGAEGDLAAVEFVSTSISSGGDGVNIRPGWDRVLAANPFLKLVNDQRGYTVHEVTPDAWRADLKVMDRVSTPGGALASRARFAVAPDGRGLQTA